MKNTKGVKMMSTTKKSQFIAESLAKSIKKHITNFKKSNRKLLKSIEDSMDCHGFTNLMTQAIVEIIKVMGEWEEKSFPELDGLTPKQYFDSLNTINDFVELVSLLEAKNKGILPVGLFERIKKFDDAFSDDLLNALESIQLGEEKCFSSEQKAIVRITGILGLPKFINALIGIIYQLDNEKSNEDTFTALMNAITGIGEPALESLINLVENIEKKGRLYGYLILTIGKIASENKSERIYRLLKDYFRKSENKVIEANALAVYGDGRAIPAIRGYVERNLEDLSYWEYSQFREAVLLLGGNMSDLDVYFDDYDEFDEEEEFYDE